MIVDIYAVCAWSSVLGLRMRVKNIYIYRKTITQVNDYKVKVSYMLSVDWRMAAMLDFLAILIR